MGVRRVVCFGLDGARFEEACGVSGVDFEVGDGAGDDRAGGGDGP